MTPLHARLSRYLPPPATWLVMTTIYASLLVLIVTFLIAPGQFELVYLDLGR